ncbi:MAG TPA: methyltransferase domain-containing protein [Puia sp.]|nr:methyltransferase domain-containing protein [Puia sp.]
MAAGLSPTLPSEGITARLAGWLVPGQYSQDWALEQLNILPYQHLLEVGYGSGKMLQAVAKKLKIGFIAGTDCSVSMYERATRRNRRAIEDQLVQLHIGSLYQLPYPSHYFHTIYGTNIHLSWKDPAMEYLRLSNLLRTGGRLVTILQPQWPQQERTVRHTMEKIQEYYIEAGLTDIRIRYKDADRLTGVAITGYKA